MKKLFEATKVEILEKKVANWLLKQKCKGEEFPNIKAKATFRPNLKKMEITWDKKNQ